jgi:hypothetical protein
MTQVNTFGFAGQTRFSYPASRELIEVKVAGDTVSYTVVEPGMVEIAPVAQGDMVSLVYASSDASANGGVAEIQLAEMAKYWAETETPMLAGARYIGPTRDAEPVKSRWSWFNASAYTDKPGTLWIEISNDGVTWYPATGYVAVAANTSGTTAISIVARYFRSVFQVAEAGTVEQPVLDGEGEPVLDGEGNPEMETVPDPDADQTVFAMNTSFTRN